MKPLARPAASIVAGLLPRALAAALLVAAGGAQAVIYSCIDGNGRKLTSDRPIAQCLDREQRVHSLDGSVRRIVPPTPTADERAEQEARERQEAAERAAQKDAARRDRNLMARFPYEAAHHKARASALDDVRKSIAISERRLASLAAERKPLMDESEFYVGKSLPLKLRQQLDANDAATEAQRALIQNQQAELVRINALYDAELAHLQKLWAGARPGSIGRAPADPATSPAKKTAAR